MPVSVRSAVATLPAYKPGKPAPLGPGGVSFKLSSNENPYPPLPGVLQSVALSCEQMNRYPDLANVAMTRAVADRLGVEQDQLAFGTGSVAVLYHLLQAICGPGDDVIFAWRSFEAYPIAVQITGATAVTVPLGPGARHDLEAMRAAITPATKVILLCTPNNPTGPTLSHREVVDFVESVRDDILVIIDEAYVEFVTDPDAARGLDVLVGRPNVAVLRTFSKAYGLAGFRVGYVVADPEIADAVKAVSLPFGVSIPAQAAVLASLEAEPELLDRVASLVSARDDLAESLRAQGFEVPDAQGNFVWLPVGPRSTDYAAAFAAAGVMVRAYVAGDDADGIRITVGTEEANAVVTKVAYALPRA